MKQILEKLLNKESLTHDETADVMELIAIGKTDPIQTGAFLTLLRAKGETSTEVAALVSVMLKHCVGVDIDGPMLDIVGTGGDGANTVNISTAAAILTAAAGARVAKHGNRSVSSRSGSADVLEKLDVPMLLPENIGTCVQESNIAFMYSPHFHPAMKYVVPVRRALGVRTVFNILGPLLNPARTKYMVIGVYTPDILDLYATVLQSLGVEHALVVHCAGLDELNSMGIAQAREITKEKGIISLQIDPAEIGVPPCKLEDLRGGDAQENAAIIRSLFSGGEKCENPLGNTICYNAAAGLYVYGLADSIAAGYKLAKEVLASGKALNTLEKWSQVSRKLDSSP